MARRLVFACQFGVGEATASDLRHGEFESLCIVSRAIFGGAIVVAENLFVNVLFKMKGLNSNVGPLRPRFNSDQKFSMPFT